MVRDRAGIRVCTPNIFYMKCTPCIAHSRTHNNIHIGTHTAQNSWIIIWARGNTAEEQKKKKKKWQNWKRENQHACTARKRKKTKSESWQENVIDIGVGQTSACIEGAKMIVRKSCVFIKIEAKTCRVCAGVCERWKVNSGENAQGT